MGSIDLSTVTMVVVDEVDRMCTYQFLPVVESILQNLNPACVRCFYSATYSTKARRIVEGWCGSASYVDVKIGNNNAAESVEQHVVVLGKKEEKVSWLRKTLPTLVRGGSIMIFCGMRVAVDEVGKLVSGLGGVKVGCIHGDIAQADRTKTGGN